MQGEYRGDFTRDTFNRAKRFSRVLMQQGCVQLDADWNEQTSILWHYLRSLAADLMGPHGGPNDGFLIEPLIGDEAKQVALDFSVHGGHYYVNGIRCENDTAALAYKKQPGFPFSQDSILVSSKTYLVFLDVWERHITCNQDGDICEVALGGPDTATRAQVVSQVKVLLLGTAEATKDLEKAVADLQKAAGTAISPAHQVVDLKFTAIQEKLATNGTLRARARVAEKSTDPCTISPESQYRGAENQLYRVEIHKGGVAWKGTPDNAGNAVEAATFKWSRDNGSVIFPILTLADDTIKLASLGRDKRQSLKIGDWVEIVDDADALRGEAGPLLQVKDIKPDEMVITLSASANRTYKENDSRHPLLRRWDQPDSNGNRAESALLLKEDKGEDDKNWIALEDGVQIQFTPPPPGSSNTYRAGDYWLIPARVATGDVLWPKQNKPTGEVDTYPSGNPIPATLSPHGVEHNYAPLAVVDVGGDGTITPVTDLRRTFTPLAL